MPRSTSIGIKKSKPSNIRWWVSAASVAMSMWFAKDYLPQWKSLLAEPEGEWHIKPSERSNAWNISQSAGLINELMKVGQKVEEGGEQEVPWALERLAEIESFVRGDDETARQQRALIEYVRRGVKNDTSVLDGPAVAQELGLVTYGSPEYWEDAYRTGRYGESYDWFAGYTTQAEEGYSLDSIIKAALGDQAPSTVPTLILGCGNSNMSAEVSRSGFPVDSIDISSVVINKMAALEPTLGWHTMDARNLTFEADRFGLVMEKGLLDAFDASTADLSVPQTLASTTRVMRPGALLLSMSLADPAKRQTELSEHGLTCEEARKFTGKKSAEDSKDIHVHLCRKVSSTA